MTWTGRRSDWPARLFAAVFMVILLLSASLLVSAGSDHHAHAAEPAAAVAVNDPTVSVAPAHHEHRHGNDWTPSPAQRLRPVAGDTVVCAVPICASSTGRPLTGPANHVPSASPDDGLTLLGVLRI